MATYITTQEFEDYCTLRGITIPTNSSILIQKATDYITATFYDNLIGYKVSDTQPLLFPRLNDDGTTIDETSLKMAVCSLAVRVQTESLFLDSDKIITKEKLEGLEVTYSADGVDKKRFNDAYNYMRPYLIGSGSSKRVVRS